MTHPNAHRWNLPVETTCHILSLCTDDSYERVDKETLRSCSLVSKTWNDIVLPLLFSDLTITFRNSDGGEYLEHGVPTWFTDWYYEYLEHIHTSDLPALLQQTGRRILPVVKTLRLVAKLDIQLGVHPDPEAPCPDFLEPQEFCNIVDLFPSIKNLFLTDIVLRVRPEADLGLQHLDLDSLCFDVTGWMNDPVMMWRLETKTPENYLWMFCLFGSVQRLVLLGLNDEDCLRDGESGRLDTLVGSSLRIQSLEIADAMPMGAFIQAMHRDPNVVANLVSLDIRDSVHIWSWSSISDLVDSLPNGLSHFGICIEAFYDDDHFLSQFAIFVTSPKMTNLRSLTLHDIVWSSDPDHQGWYGEHLQCIPQVLEALSSAQASNLECITLVMKAPQWAREVLDWSFEFPSEPHEAFAAIQEAILRMPTLKTLVIDNSHWKQETSGYSKTVSTITSSARASYRRFFPLLHSEGYLQILPAEA